MLWNWYSTIFQNYLTKINTLEGWNLLYHLLNPNRSLITNGQLFRLQNCKIIIANAMARPLSTIFKSTKPHILKPPKPSNFESNLKVPSSSSCSTSRKSDANSQQSYPELLTSPASNSTEFSNSKKKKSLWCVYLILSTNPPIKTYVGVTTNFCRRWVLFILRGN